MVFGAELNLGGCQRLKGEIDGRKREGGRRLELTAVRTRQSSAIK